MPLELECLNDKRPFVKGAACARGHDAGGAVPDVAVISGGYEAAGQIGERAQAHETGNRGKIEKHSRCPDPRAERECLIPPRIEQPEILERQGVNNWPKT